ncbi:hypothetical protein [Hoylesella pleuritidis]|uniref:hypothetical protein n=1 Tax=Hoylesella pleuritidis TaxID=407975 RepID=UPI0028D5B201|nr:hypothetical protein [Hoylesella pleuritidis]
MILYSRLIHFQPFSFRKKLRFQREDIVIKDDMWFGADVLILLGVAIAIGSVILRQEVLS